MAGFLQKRAALAHRYGLDFIGQPMAVTRSETVAELVRHGRTRQEYTEATGDPGQCFAGESVESRILTDLSFVTDQDVLRFLGY